MSDSVLNAFAFIICVGPPALIIGGGIYSFLKRPRTPFSDMAGFLTLKPFVATPLFMMALSVSLSWFNENPSALTLIASVCMSALPGAGLTALIVSQYRGVFASEMRERGITLLALDTLRWGSSVISFNFLDLDYIGADYVKFLLAPFWIASLSMPFVFALAALILVKIPRLEMWKRRRRLHFAFCPIYLSIAPPPFTPVQ